MPYKLDALGLSTEGRSQLGGVLNESDPFSGKAAYDTKKDRILFYSNKQDGGSSDLTLYEFNSKFRVASANEYQLPGFAVLSDFTITEKYAIFVQPPVVTNGMSFMLSKDPVKALKSENGPAVSDAVGILLKIFREFYAQFALLVIAYFEKRGGRSNQNYLNPI